MVANVTDKRSDYIPLADLISVFFQIRDDYMNLQSDQYADRKGFCEDLTEGKFSFPIVHGVRADTSNRQILSKSTHNKAQLFCVLPPAPAAARFPCIVS